MVNGDVPLDARYEDTLQSLAQGKVTSLIIIIEIDSNPYDTIIDMLSHIHCKHIFLLQTCLHNCKHMAEEKICGIFESKMASS